MKRAFDLAVATALLCALGPVLLAVAAAVRVDSPGPILYRGRRTGRHGRPFDMLKFRTMVADAERLGGTTTGLDDPRVTRLGRVLRRYKLDELPQLINVVRGEMSLVGPRPEVEEYTRLYGDRERAILSVRPGITDYASLRFIDLASVVGAEDVDEVYRRSVLAQKNELRLKYVRESSFAVDLKILARTVQAMLSRGHGVRSTRI
ncbi:MAG: sugar transferase [Acidimicrobiia bacterium]|nr:sugar transferase [Acidimicrobiia bacterium]